MSVMKERNPERCQDMGRLVKNRAGRICNLQILDIVVLIPA